MARAMIADPKGHRMAVVVEDRLYYVDQTGTRFEIAILNTSTGHVGMKIGLNQLVVVDGGYGYVYNLRTGVFSEIDADGWLGSYTVEYLNGYFTFIDPNTQTFYVSALEDATSLDALEFATANSSPDRLIGQATVNNTLALFGDISTEIWQETGNNVDFPFEKNLGIHIDVGLMAAFSVKDIDNTIYWLGRDERGAGMVYRMENFRPVRVSTMAVEEKIQEAISDGQDVSQAVAYTYQQGGHSFYVLQVPGLDTTWVYDIASKQWHERAEFVNGDYEPHRGKYHCYCFGKHLIIGDDNIIYEYDVNANTNAGDVLVRDRISPHSATPSLDLIKYPLFELDCTVGEGKAGQESAYVQMRYSNDGGYSWSNWRQASLGAVGERQTSVQFNRCGSARDRVWQVRVTDDVPIAIIGAHIESNK